MRFRKDWTVMAIALIALRICNITISIFSYFIGSTGWRGE